MPSFYIWCLVTGDQLPMHKQKHADSTLFKKKKLSPGQGVQTSGTVWLSKTYLLILLNDASLQYGVWLSSKQRRVFYLCRSAFSSRVFPLLLLVKLKRHPGLQPRIRSICTPTSELAGISQIDPSAWSTPAWCLVTMSDISKRRQYCALFLYLWKDQACHYTEEEIMFMQILRPRLVSRNGQVYLKLEYFANGDM